MAALHPESELFDKLRAGWKQENNAPAFDFERIRQAAESDVLQLHQRYRRAAFFITASFIVAIAVTFGVFFRYNDHGPMFYGAIIAMNLIMITMAVMMWVGVQFDKNSFALSSIGHIEHSLRKLRFRRFTKVYAAPVYMVLLMVALSCYYYDVLKEASLTFRFSAYSITFAYCAGVYFFSKRRAKPNLDQMNKVISDLEQLKQALQSNEKS